MVGRVSWGEHPKASLDTKLWRQRSAIHLLFYIMLR
jgi:hypothetical protein